MSISNESVTVVETEEKNCVIPLITIAEAMGKPWKNTIKNTICDTIRMVDVGVYEADGYGTVTMVCTVTPLAGKYVMLTTFTKSV